MTAQGTGSQLDVGRVLTPAQQRWRSWAPFPPLCIGASNSKRQFRECGCSQRVQQHLPTQDAHLLTILWHVRAEDVQPGADAAALQRAAPLPVVVHKVPELVPEDVRLDSISKCQFAQNSVLWQLPECQQQDVTHILPMICCNPKSSALRSTAAVACCRAHSSRY